MDLYHIVWREVFSAECLSSLQSFQERLESRCQHASRYVQLHQRILGHSNLLQPFAFSEPDESRVEHRFALEGPEVNVSKVAGGVSDHVDERHKMAVKDKFELVGTIYDGCGLAPYDFACPEKVYGSVVLTCSCPLQCQALVQELVSTGAAFRAFAKLVVRDAADLDAWSRCQSQLVDGVPDFRRQVEEASLVAVGGD